MNYRIAALNYIKESQTDEINFYEEEGRSIDALSKAYELVCSILDTRFENELRQYNNDEEKAYDLFVFKKNLDYLRLYIEEFILLDKPVETIDSYKAVRHHMRQILHGLHKEIAMNT